MQSRQDAATKQNHNPAAKKEKIDRVLGMVTPEDYTRLTKSFEELFGLEYKTVKAHPFNIKTIIKDKDFTFSEGQSLSSKVFVILHSLGHYYFISRAHSTKNDRYEYIYDKKEKQAALRTHDELIQRTSLHEPQVVTEKIMKDRIAFEVGANNFSFLLLKHVGMTHLAEVVNIYQPGDINYILDVTAGGKDAIVQTDYDYLERYICNDLSYEEEISDEKIYDPENFQVDGIDWNYLSEIKLEVHFF